MSLYSLSTVKLNVLLSNINPLNLITNYSSEIFILKTNNVLQLSFFKVQFQLYKFKKLEIFSYRIIDHLITNI